MMIEQKEKELYQALGDLKDNLEKIKKAGEQVDATVAAYAEMGKTMEGYVTALNDITHSVESLYNAIDKGNASQRRQIDHVINQMNSTMGSAKEAQDLLSKKCEHAMAEFERNANSATKKLESSTDEIVKTFGSETGEAVDAIKNSMASLIENISQIGEEIKTAQQKQSTLIASSKDELAQSIKSLKELVEDKVEKRLKIIQCVACLIAMLLAIFIVVYLCEDWDSVMLR